MREKKASRPGDLDGKPGRFRGHVGQAEEDQGNPFALLAMLPVALDGSELGRLMLHGVEPVLIADQRLDGRGDEKHPHRHRQHGADPRVVPSAQQLPGRRAGDHERRGDVRRDDGVRETVGEGGIEDDAQPIDGHDAAVDDLVTLGRVHPTVRREDPCRRDERTDCHCQRRHEVQAGTDTITSEQHDAEEASLKEERRKHLVCEQRPRHPAGKTREIAPVGAELVGHHQARDHPHAKRHRKHLDPELVEIDVHLALGAQPQCLEHSEVACQPDGQGRKDDVKRNGEPELDSGEQY